MARQGKWNRNDASPAQRQASEQRPIRVDGGIAARLRGGKRATDQPNDPVVVFDQPEGARIAEEQLNCVELVCRTRRGGNDVRP